MSVRLRKAGSAGPGASLTETMRRSRQLLLGERIFVIPHTSNDRQDVFKEQFEFIQRSGGVTVSRRTVAAPVSGRLLGPVGRLKFVKKARDTLLGRH